jgi:tetratricopeptide (TPR) repeat protein
MADYKARWGAVTARQLDKAIASANAGIVKYPQATIARLCLASAYQLKNLPADSVLRVTDEVRKIDPKNSLVLRIASGAYKQKADSAAAHGMADVATAANEQAVRSLVQLMALEPGNPGLADQVIAALAQMGKPETALPIVDTLLIQTPGDAKLLQSKWRLVLAAAASAQDTAARVRYFGLAVSTGEAMVRADSSMADSTYFARQIIAGSLLTPPRSAEFAAKAVQKYPNNASFWASKANAERRAGQSQMALESMKRAMSLNPQTANGNVFLAQVYVDLNQADSAVALARRAVAAGEDKRTWGAMLLAPTAQIFAQAQKNGDVAGFRRAYALAQESDKLSPSPTGKFFLGAAAFSIGADSYKVAQQAVEQANKTKGKSAKASLLAKACPAAKEAQDMFVQTQINMPGGGSVDPKTAQQLLGYASQFGPAAEQMAKSACK